MFAITRSRSPLAEWQAATNGLNRLFDEAFRSWPLSPEDSTLTGTWIPPVDVTEDTNEVRIAAELPGVKPEDVKITVENNVLTMRGEKVQAAEHKDGRSHRFERSYGAFERSFTLPATVDADRIQATYEQGVLSVSLPKVERAKPREIAVKVQT